MSKKKGKGGKSYKGMKKQQDKSGIVSTHVSQRQVSAEPVNTTRTGSSASGMTPGDQQDAVRGNGHGTLHQHRAAFALERVQSWAGRDPEEQKKLNSYAAKMPFMVHANGLGQTAAFYRAKKNTDPHRLLYALLSDWLTRSGQPFAHHDELLDGITAADLHTYMAAQAEAMLFLGWVKQFADAFLESE